MNTMKTMMLAAAAVLTLGAGAVSAAPAQDVQTVPAARVHTQQGARFTAPMTDQYGASDHEASKNQTPAFTFGSGG